MASVFVKVRTMDGRETVVEMPGVTTVHYAAQRCAGAFRLNEGLYWGLYGTDKLPDEDIIAEWSELPLPVR